jgi:hypothetical protein
VAASSGRGCRSGARPFDYYRNRQSLAGREGGATEKYLFLLYGPDRPFPQPGTSEFREMLEAWTTATEAMAKAGVLIDCRLRELELPERP